MADLYRTLDGPGTNPLRDAHARLDAAVRAAYGMPGEADVLAFLLDLNQACAPIRYMLTTDDRLIRRASRATKSPNWRTRDSSLRRPAPASRATPARSRGAARVQ